MEKADQELLQQVSERDTRLKKLFDQHRKLGKEVERFGLYAAYSPSAALRETELKKEKLRHKEQIMDILREYRENGRIHL